MHPIGSAHLVFPSHRPRGTHTASEVLTKDECFAAQYRTAGDTNGARDPHQLPHPTNVLVTKVNNIRRSATSRSQRHIWSEDQCLERLA